MRTRILKDRIAQKLTFFITAGVAGILFLIAFGLFQRSKSIIGVAGLKETIFSTTWHPLQGHFGLASFIVGTLWVTAIAIVIAVPLSIMTALYLTEYCKSRTQRLIRPVIDVLAGISPVIYGFWGVIAIVPIVRKYLMPFFSQNLPFFPFKSDNYTGFSALAGGIVLSVMVLPLIVSIVMEVLKTVPFTMKEASYALGATKWQTTQRIILKKARGGIIAAIILGLSRAFGETIAVLMVAGCALGMMPKSIFDPAYPLPALIANTYGEMMSIPLYDSAIMFAALVLLAITALFNMLGWWMLIKAERQV